MTQYLADAHHVRRPDRAVRGLVERRRHLPGVPPQLRRRERRRHGRPSGHPQPSAVPQGPRRRRGVAEPLLRLPAGRRRLRRRRLPGHRPDVRHAPGRRRADPGRARTGAAHHRRPGAQPLLGRPRVVQARAAGGPRVRAARALPLPSRQGRERRTPAQRLGVHLRRPRLDPYREPRRDARRLVSPPLRPGAAGLQLGAPGRRRRVPLDPALLARHGRRRLPYRRRPRPGQGGGPARPRRQRPAEAAGQ